MNKLQISKSEFKAKALEFFRQVEFSGMPLIVTDHGKPSIEIRPYHTKKRSPFEILKGSVTEYHDPTEPVGEDDWETLS
ncbi:MAG: type II toxin-antitoxin system Phd/YefM family antitoxin [Gammaproteobacteria bacterium]|nr:type II toxin-antitoxin system Phd/YefM family antitoxin [Gammaproteobacteria bacterium]